MAVTAKMMGQCLIKALNKELDWDTDTIKVMLYEDDLVIDQDTMIYLDDIVTGTEASGTGYTAGGDTLASKTIDYTAGTNTIKLDAADTTWTASTITAMYAVIYQDTTVASTSVLIAYVDFGQNESSSNGDFKITWHTDGIATIVAS